LSQLQKTLQEYWGHTSFRPLQEEIITAVLNQKDVLALLPTGGGKSVCYQLPALLCEGCCLVVSPLIALMQDQVQQLTRRNIPAVALHAGIPYNDIKQILRKAIHGEYKLLYCSPERLQSTLFQDFLPELPLCFVAVDEAHCISQWGHDFRPSYLKIARLKEIFPDIPFLTLTATATAEVQEDIIRQLQLKNPLLFKSSFQKKNLYYQITYRENKAPACIAAVQAQPQAPQIVYCRSRKQTESLATQLQAHQLKATAYHAGMSKDKREDAQEQWITEAAPTIVATTAFGMGIDKPNVRLVVHIDVPEHPEAYFQEVGRAGRDGAPAKAVLLWNENDCNNLMESTSIKYPEAAFLRKVYQSVCEYLQLEIGTQPDRYYDFDVADFVAKFKLPTLPCYAALRLLEQEGLWTMTESVFKLGTVQFSVDREVLDRLYNVHPHLGVVCLALLRLYSSIFSFPTAVRLPVIAKRCNLTVSATEQCLQELSRMQVIDYQPPTDKPQLFFHHYRVDSRFLSLNMKRIAHLRQQHQERVEAMITILRNTQYCRELLLLRYFGEKVPTHYQCGHCDICTQKKQPNRDMGTMKQTILQALQQQSQSLEELMNHFETAVHTQVLEYLRRLQDDALIVRRKDGQFDLNKKP